MSIDPEHVTDPDRRGPDYDHPTPTQEHLDQRWKDLPAVGPATAISEPIVPAPANSANYTLTRLGYKIAGVIIHTTVGSEASAIAAFQSPARQASAHYIVACDGSHVDQCVAEADIAWQCGRFYTDASDPLANVNTIGIEHCDDGNYNSPRPDGLYQTSADLVRDICKRYGIAINRTNIRKHKEVSASATSCPDLLDIDRIVAMAAGAPAPTPVVGDEELVYVGPIHPLTASFKVFDTGEDSYPDPAPVAAMGHPLPQGQTISVDAYCYSSAPVQSADLGSGTPGPDYLYYRSSGRWVPDAHLDTTTLPTAPKPQIPAGETLLLYPGQQGPPGAKGQDGDKGPTGDKGPQGDPGVGGTLPDHRHDITILQLFGGATGGVKATP